MYEKCSKNILRSIFLLFCYIKKDQLILFAGRTCIYRLEHICRVRTKTVQVTVYMQEIQKAGFRADLACIYNKKERDLVRISRRSIGPVRIQDIICLEEVYPFDTYILLNLYVYNI